MSQRVHARGTRPKHLLINGLLVRCVRRARPQPPRLPRMLARRPRPRSQPPSRGFQHARWSMRTSMASEGARLANTPVHHIELVRLPPSGLKAARRGRASRVIQCIEFQQPSTTCTALSSAGPALAQYQTVVRAESEPTGIVATRHEHGGLKPHALNSITHSFTHSTSTRAKRVACTTRAMDD